MSKAEEKRIADNKREYKERCRKEKRETDIWIRGFKAGAKATGD